MFSRFLYSTGLRCPGALEGPPSPHQLSVNLCNQNVMLVCGGLFPPVNASFRPSFRGFVQVAAHVMRCEACQWVHPQWGKLWHRSKSSTGMISTYLAGTGHRHPRWSTKCTDRHKTAPASSTETRPGEPESRMRSENGQPSDFAAPSRASSRMTSSSVADCSCGAWNFVTVVTSTAFGSEIRTEVACPS